jgi:hypothetical protein
MKVSGGPLQIIAGRQSFALRLPVLSLGYLSAPQPGEAGRGHFSRCSVNTGHPN